MKPSEVYFDRNRGSWDWSMVFNILSYRRLWHSDLKLPTKLRISVFAFSQYMFGPFHMRTHVDFRREDQTVLHSTQISKWGITFYRSEKMFFLAPDSLGLRLEGAEYFWPQGSRAVPFDPAFGVVDQSAPQASYKMPLAGAFCDCRTHLGQPDGYIEIMTPWLRGRFTLVESSARILASRLR